MIIKYWNDLAIGDAIDNYVESTSYKINISKIIIKPKTTTTMYHMRTFVASTCMHVVHCGGFRFGDDFEYSSYLIPQSSSTEVPLLSILYISFFLFWAQFEKI
jgi:hypothetical protein